jgi:hypothetical protein
VPLDEAREFVCTIDSLRSFSAIPTEDGETVVLTMTDPQDTTLIEVTQAELAEVIDGLSKLRKP